MAADNFDIELLYLDYLEDMRPQRLHYTRCNHFEEMDEKKFFERYRFKKIVVLKFLEEIEHRLEYTSDRNNPLSPIQQLLLALRFYATGSFQIVMGDCNGISKSTVCRCIHKVSHAIASLRPHYVKFPTGTEVQEVVREFYNIAQFPGVIGTLDCTHIPIISPGGNMAERFRNRKGYFSLNVQTMSDAQLLIRDIVARWPGSVHDSTIFNNCEKRMLFETGQVQQGLLLLGDNGYPLKPYLMTPLLNPRSEAEQQYNEAHIRSRNTVERQYGLWKRRFPVLSLGLRTTLEHAMVIIVATAVLHNIAIMVKDEVPPEDAVLHEFLMARRGADPHFLQYGNVPVANVAADQDRGAAAAIRMGIINNHFA